MRPTAPAHCGTPALATVINVKRREKKLLAKERTSRNQIKLQRISVYSSYAGLESHLKILQTEKPVHDI